MATQSVTIRDEIHTLQSATAMLSDKAGSRRLNGVSVRCAI
jgi:hypothetical protein